jgi:hypothetical protein
MGSSLRIPILNTEYAVVVGWGELTEVNRILRRWHYPDQLEEFETRGYCMWRRGNHPIVLLPGPPTAPAEIATLAHEAVHAVIHILDTIGAEYDTEIIAHSVGAVGRLWTVMCRDLTRR